MSTDIQNLRSFDPFAEAEDAGGEVNRAGNQQNYIHIRIQRTYIFANNLTPQSHTCATPARHNAPTPRPPKTQG